MKCFKKKVKTTKAKVAGLTVGLITIGFFIGNTPVEIEANIEALEAVERVVHSSCFAEKWLKSDLDLTQTNNMSREESLRYITTTPVKMNLEAYRDNSGKVIGYTYPSSDTVWFNRKFHDNFTVCEKASNFWHEILHRQGFKHDQKPTKRRPFSVPYIGGKIMKECCEMEAK